ncbi:hypothetical protein EsH8_XV_000009 [Colletotrichum jinshuiense]
MHNGADISSLSISAILRRHHRERLLVMPLYWTARHLDLLGCTFVHDTPPSTDTNADPTPVQLSPPLSPHRRPEDDSVPDARSDSTRPGTNTPGDGPSPRPLTKPRPSPLDRQVTTLARGQWTPPKASALAAILTASRAGIQRISKQLRFRFEAHSVSMPCSVLSCPPEPTPEPTSTANRPLLSIAYLDRYDIRLAREDSLEYIRCPPRSGRPSRATASLYAKQLAQITPAEPLRDPYIVALLIALAQSQRRQCARADVPSAPESFRVRVLLSDTKNNSHITLYTADVPAAALDRFSSPHEAPRTASGILVRSVHIPFQPYSSFHERLTRAMFPRGLKRGRESDTAGDENRKLARRQ